MDGDVTTRWRRWAHLAGRVLAITAVGFVGYALAAEWANIRDWRPTWPEISMIFALPLLYAGALFLLAFNWVSIVNEAADNTIARRLVFRSYTDAQIAKYIPGNIFHFVGRHIALRQAGLSHAVAARAAAFEIASLPVAAIMVVLGLQLALPAAAVPTASLSPLLIAGAVGSVLLVYLWLMRWVPLAVGPGIIVLMRASVFMVLQGLVFAVLLFAVSGTFLFFAIPLAIAVWLVGYLTPGAPGGIGVREAALIAVMPPAVADETVILAAILFRIVTTLGDVILYPAGRAFGPARRESD